MAISAVADSAAPEQDRTSSSRANTALVGQRSRHRIPAFRLHRPGTQAEAVAALTGAPGPAVYMAGGIDVIDRMKNGMPVADVVHLDRIAALRTIRLEGHDLVVGAGATHHSLASSDPARRVLPSFAGACSNLANVRIRLKGTVGGNIMSCEPSYDLRMVAIALGAELTFATLEGIVTRAADSVYLRDAAALLLHLRIPAAASQTLYVERGWKPVISFALSLQRGHTGFERIRLAAGAGFPLGAYSETIFAAPRTSAALAADRVDLTRALLGGFPQAVDDHIASAGYRLRLLHILVARQLSATVTWGHSR